MTLGGPEVAIFGPQWFSSQILQGSYSVYLQESFVGPGPPLTVAIAQTGLIPSTAKSLTFFSSPSTLFQVTFAGQVIPLKQLGSGPNYLFREVTSLSLQDRRENCGLRPAPVFSTTFSSHL